MSQKQQFDIAWKNILDTYFQDFLTLLHPVAAAAIDWSVPHEFLDKELTTVARGSATGSGIVDKLVKVQTKEKKVNWVLVHIEIQSQPQNDFPKRMYTYYSRLLDRYQTPIFSLAVLADAQPNWRPPAYKTGLWDCELRFKYATLKLLDFKDRQDFLENSTNPFAIVILAHLAALQTQKNNDHRLKVKVQLTKRLYQKGWSKTAIVELFTFIDWALVLPEEFEVEYQEHIKHHEQELGMELISHVALINIEKGRQEGLQLGLQEGLQKGRQEGREEGREEGERAILTHLLQQKFGDLPSAIQTQLEQADSSQLLSWSKAILSAQSLQDIFQARNNSH